MWSYHNVNNPEINVICDSNNQTFQNTFKNSFIFVYEYIQVHVCLCMCVYTNKISLDKPQAATIGYIYKINTDFSFLLSWIRNV